MNHNPNSNKLLGDAFPFLWFVLEMGFHSIAHASPKLISILLPVLPNAEIIGMSHHSHMGLIVDVVVLSV